MATTTNLYIDQGADFAETIIVKTIHGDVIDITGASVRSEARFSFTTSTPFPFTCTIVDAVNGVVRLSMTNAQTSAMRPGRYVYDGVIQIGDFITRFVQGLATVSPSVTQ